MGRGHAQRNANRSGIKTHEKPLSCFRRADGTTLGGVRQIRERFLTVAPRPRIYGISMTGACQKFAFWLVGSRTVTWQVYGPAGSFASARLNFSGVVFKRLLSDSFTCMGGVSNAL